jgi:hypothetical protein
VSIVPSQSVAFLDRLHHVLPGVNLLVERISLDPSTLVQSPPGIDHGLIILGAERLIPHASMIQQDNANHVLICR